MMSSLFASALAQRSIGLVPSPVRSVFDASMLPGMISLAGGNPDLSFLPTDEVAELAHSLIAQDSTTVLQYGASAGTDELRSAVRELMHDQGVDCSEDEILITAGSQMALEVVTSLLCDPEDVVLTEAPTYSGALGIFRTLQARVDQVACDQDGLIPEALEAHIAHHLAQKHPVKFLYTVPNFNNPTGIVLSAQRRERIVQICARAGVIIVEDDPYGLLSFDAAVPRPLRALDPHVLYLGSMSKIFSPGIRTGWVIAPAEVRSRLQRIASSTTICASVLSQRLAAAYLHSDNWRRALAAAVDGYRSRCEAVMAALTAHAPQDTSWTHPRGGFFTWVRLPHGWSSTALLPAALERGAAFVPGTGFFSDGSGDDHLRLSFSLESPVRLAEGVRRIFAAAASPP